MQVLWAFCVYLEAVSVLPQLRMMQKAKVRTRPVKAWVPLSVVTGSSTRMAQAWQEKPTVLSRARCSRDGLCPGQVVERFTAHYVFALGMSRFLSCAHWILQVRAGERAKAPGGVLAEARCSVGRFGLAPSLRGR